MKLPPLQRPNTTLRVPIKIDGLGCGDEARVVVAAVDVGILNLTNYKPPAPDDYYLGQRRLIGRDPRSLRPADRRHAGHARPDQDRRRRRRPSSNGSPPTQAPLALYSGIVTVKPDGTAEVAFDIPAFAGTVRVMAVAWSKDKVGRASGDVIVRDPVVLTATLPRFLLTGDRSTHAPRPRQRRGPGRRLQRHCAHAKARSRVGDGMSQTICGCAPSSATSVERAADRVTAAGTGHRQGRDHRAGRLRARAQLRAERQARDAGAGAPHGEADRQGREPHAVERSVRRSGARHRRGGALGRRLDRARRRDAAQGARPLSVRLLRADHQPGAAAALRQRARQRRASGARRRHRPAHPRRHRPRAGAPGVERLVRPLGRRRRRRLARRLRHRLPDAGASERGFAVPDVAFKLALDRLRNIGRQRAGRRRRTAAAISPMRSMCWRGTASRRSAICAISPTPSSTISARRSPRRRSPRRWACSATAPAPSGSTRRRSTIIKPPAQTGAVQPRRLRLDAARRGGAGDARKRSRRLAADHRQRGASASSRRGRARPTPRRRRTPGWCWPRARWPRTPAASRSTSRAQPHKGALYRNVKASELAQPLKVTNTGDGTLQAVVSVSGAPTAPEPAAEQRLQDRAALLHARWRGRRSDARPSRTSASSWCCKITEPQPQFGRVHRRRLSAGRLRDRQPAAGVVRRDRHAVVDRGRQGAGAFGVPRRPLQRGVRARGRRTRRCSRWPMWCARCRPAATCCRRPMSRTCTGPTASAAPAPARSRSRRSDARDERSVAPHPLPSPAPRLSSRRSAARGGSCRSARCRAAPTLDALDAGARPQRAGCCAPMRRRRAAGGCRSTVDRRRSALHRDAAGLRGPALPRARGVDPLAMARAAWQWVGNGRVISGGSTLTMQVARLLEPRAERTLGAKLRQIVRAHRARAQR